MPSLGLRADFPFYVFVELRISWEALEQGVGRLQGVGLEPTGTGSVLGQGWMGLEGRVGVCGGKAVFSRL